MFFTEKFNDKFRRIVELVAYIDHTVKLENVFY